MKFYVMRDAINYNTAPKEGFSSLFAAINAANKENSKTVCVREHCPTGNIVWQKSDVPMYHRYIGQKYYGFVETEQQAKEWANSHDNSHVITGHDYITEPPVSVKRNVFGAFPIYENVKNIKGDIENIWPEKNLGAYYYNFSKTTDQYQKVSAVFDLSEAAIKVNNKEVEHRPFNFHIYVGIKQPNTCTTYEAGFILSGERTPVNIHAFVKAAGHNLTRHTCYAPTPIHIKGIYSYNGLLKVELNIPADGILEATFDNLKGLKTTIQVADDTIKKGVEHRFFTAVTFPSYYQSWGELFDSRSGCYAKNIKIKNAVVCNSSKFCEGISITPDSNLSENVHLYNTDCVSYEHDGCGKKSVETISIFYDKDIE